MSERDGSKVARTLRESILRLDLRPGELLDEAELADQLEVSRTPVREAIIQLIADGLVVREGRKAKVAPLDFDDVPKLYDALLISSRLVHRLAAENRTERDLKEIERHMRAFDRAVASCDGVLLSEANADFHTAISNATGNRYISNFYEQALVGTIRLARACFSYGQGTEVGEKAQELRAHLATTTGEHAEIFAAIKARDVEAADALAVSHYKLTKARIMKVIFDPDLGLVNLGDISLDRWKVA